MRRVSKAAADNTLYRRENTSTEESTLFDAHYQYKIDGDKNALVQKIAAEKIAIANTYGALYTAHQDFLPSLPEDKHEAMDAWGRHLADIKNLQEEIKQNLVAEDGLQYPKEIVDITMLLVSCALVPSFTYSRKTIEGNYTIRLEIVEKSFKDATGLGPALFAEIEKHLPTDTPEQQKISQEYWQDIHKHPEIYDSILSRRLEHDTPFDFVITARAKTLLSTVAKLIRKQPLVVTDAVATCQHYIRYYTHLTNLATDLTTIERNATQDQKQSYRIESKKSQINAAQQKFEKISQDLDSIREQFTQTINDLFGISIVTTAVIDNPYRDPTLAPEQTKKIVDEYIMQQSQSHVKRMLYIIGRVSTDTTLQDKYAKTYSYFLQAAANHTSADEAGKQINEYTIIVIEELLKHPNILKELLNETNLSPLERSLFSILFFAHKSGWTIKDVSDYIAVFKRDEHNSAAHSGIQLQITDNTGKTFEIQIKDQIMYDNSLQGAGNHADYKLPQIKDAREKTAVIAGTALTTTNNLYGNEIT